MPPSPANMPTAREFAALSRSAQLDILRRASSRQKLQLLIDAADGEALLAEMPAQDLYLLACELGAEQIPELLEMASAEQWQAFFDFDCWEGDAFAADAARSWLAVLLVGKPSRVVAVLQEIDFELLTLILQREVRVLSGPEDLEQEGADDYGPRRDCGYVVDFRDEDGAKLYGELIDRLFRQAPEFCRELLEAGRAEGASLLEEEVYQQRTGRLLDQGLPEPHAARAIYAWLDPAAFAQRREPKLPLGGGATGIAPGAALQLARPGGVLGKVLDAGIDAQTAWELASLVNKVIMAERVDLGDLAAVRSLTARSYALLNLALEYLAGNDVAVASRCLQQEYAEQLFRLGHSLTLNLQRRAGAVRQAPCGAYLDGPYRQLVEALLQTPPQFAEVLVRPDRGGGRLFATLREVRLVEEWLARLEAQRRLFEDHFPFRLPPADDWKLTGCHPGHGRELTLSTIFLTALANRLLQRQFVPQPLSPGELPELHALISRGRGVDPQLRTQTRAWLETLEPQGGAFADFCLNVWEDELCDVSPAALDPRFVGGLIVRLGEGR